MEAVSTDARLQKVMAATAAKTMPDIFKILPEELFQFAKRGYIADLGGLVDEIGRDNFANGSLTMVDGKISEVPYTLGNFKIGRASGRERVCQTGENSGVAV